MDPQSPHLKKHQTRQPAAQQPKQTPLFRFSSRSTRTFQNTNNSTNWKATHISKKAHKPQSLYITSKQTSPIRIEKSNFFCFWFKSRNRRHTYLQEHTKEHSLPPLAWEKRYHILLLPGVEMTGHHDMSWRNQASTWKKQKTKRWWESEESTHHVRSTGLFGSFQTKSHLQSRNTFEKEVEGEEKRAATRQERHELELLQRRSNTVASLLLVVLVEP